MNFILSADTDIGTTKNTNQDSFCAQVLETPMGKMVFAVLCDGMGGLEKGELASATVVHAYKNWAGSRLSDLCASGFSDADIRQDWVNIALECNEKIKLYGSRSGVSLGTTVTVVLLTEKRYYILNVGDTRAYEISDAVHILTHDQTVVAHEIELGHITPEEAETDSRRSVLLQCVGASDAVYPDMFFGDVQQNAVYMLCTDGFRHEISADEMYQYLNAGQMLNAEGMQSNIRALINLDMQRQERDNITAIAIRTF